VVKDFSEEVCNQHAAQTNVFLEPSLSD